MVIDGISVGYVLNNSFKVCLVVVNHHRGVDCLCSAAVWKRAELSRIKQNSIARTAVKRVEDDTINLFKAS